MISLLWAVLISGVMWYFIGYHIGRRSGYEAGREHELDKAAQRHIRMSRFSDMQHKKNPCSPPLGSP